MRTLAILAALLLFPVNAEAARIIVSSDGNYHDRDDIGSTAMTLAILAKAGRQNALVAYTWADHIWQSDSWQFGQMRTSAEGARDRFGFTGRFLPAVTSPATAYNVIRDAVNSSTQDDHLNILAAGPMHVICEGVLRANPARQRYVTVVSHSDWNNTHRHGNSCTAARLKQTGITFRQIANQNTNLTLRASWADYSWMQSASANLQWVYSRMRTAKPEPDPSDAGMAYFLVTGDEHATPAKLRTFLTR